MLRLFLVFIGIFAGFVRPSGDVHPLLVRPVAQFVVRADRFEEAAHGRTPPWDPAFVGSYKFLPAPPGEKLLQIGGCVKQNVAVVVPQTDVQASFDACRGGRDSVFSGVVLGLQFSPSAVSVLCLEHFLDDVAFQELRIQFADTFVSLRKTEDRR